LGYIPAEYPLHGVFRHRSLIEYKILFSMRRKQQRGESAGNTGIIVFAYQEKRHTARFTQNAIKAAAIFPDF
jgi:hypothetical protein